MLNIKLSCLLPRRQCFPPCIQLKEAHQGASKELLAAAVKGSEAGGAAAAEVGSAEVGSAGALAASRIASSALAPGVSCRRISDS